MELQLAAALKQPGESFSFALEEPVGPQPFGGRTVAFAAPLPGRRGEAPARS